MNSVALGTSAASVTAGGSVSLDSTGSSAPAGRTLTGYQWSLTSGSTIAAFSGSTTGPTATLATSAAGSVTVQEPGTKQTARSPAGRSVARPPNVARTVAGVAQSPPVEAAAPAASGPLDWARLLDQLKIGGMARMLAQHSAPTSWDGQVLHLQVPEMHRHLLDKPYRDKLQAALEEHFKRRLRVEFTLGQPNGQTPAEVEDRARQLRQAVARRWRNWPFGADR